MTVPRSREPVRPGLHALLAVALFAVALLVLHRELREVHYTDIVRAIEALPGRRFIVAVFLTAANYLVLTGYDQLAIRHIGKRIKVARVAVASFVSYAIANNVGFQLLSGTAARYRFYSRWGIDAEDLARVVVFCSSTFWLGLLALGGWSLTFAPHPALYAYAAVPILRTLGLLLLTTAAAYLVLALVRRAPLVIRRFEISIPRPALVLGQLVLSVADWLLAAAVLYALLPSGGPGFGVLVGAFLAAQLIGLVSHVPGGLGVFEGVMLLSLAAFFEPEELLASLVLYRVVYYLLPLAFSLTILAIDEALLRRRQIARMGTLLGGLSTQLAPTVLAFFTFAAGVVLLLSGALPPDPDRIRWLDRYLPLGMFEASHFLGSVVGVILLFVAQGIRRRLNSAYYVALAGLAIGIASSLIKAADYEEAIILTALLLAFLPTRPAFARQASFLDAPFSPGWTVAAAAAIGASIWLGLFAHRHVEYTGELWWRFALNHDAPRFLRASVGATVALLAFGVARLIRPAAAEAPPPSDQDLADAGRIISAQSATLPLLVFLRDKSVLFDAARSSFLMYGVQGQTWVALGDPVGPTASAPALVRQFLERVDDFGGTPVFYQVKGDGLHRYADFGLTFIKLGEEAHVRLADFTLAGSAYRDQRAAINRLVSEGAEFEVISSVNVPPIMEELRAVSDDWLAHQRASEKGFSLGFFEPSYLGRCPVAVVRLAGRIVAFANVWPGADREELSVDLMRFREAAPKRVMDALFGWLMLWGKEQGYAWFTLGMAPLSGLESGPLAHTWSRLGHWVFRHGGALYSFQGLRAFKEKFHPQWSPRYLAYPGGLGLPRVLADITALVAGGYKRTVPRSSPRRNKRSTRTLLAAEIMSHFRRR
jgi:phosphatidylglycerol lysyltransferase